MLISVIIITYNSESFILKTLESIIVQDDNELELIISDDGSTDQTVTICQAWLEDHSHQFRRTKLVTHQSNTGIVPNINRGCKVARGEWIRLIAGDDLFLADAFVKMRTAITQYPDQKILFFQSIPFFDDITCCSLPYPNTEWIHRWNMMSPEEQFSVQLCGNQMPANSIMQRDFLKSLNYFDENYNMMEDPPMWHKILLQKHPLKIVDTSVLYYRSFHKMSISSNGCSINIRFLDSKHRFQKEKCYPYLPLWMRYSLQIAYFRDRTIIAFGNRLGFKSKIIRWFFNAVNPLALRMKIASFRHHFYLPGMNCHHD